MVAVETPTEEPTLILGASTALFSMRDYAVGPNHANYDIGPDDQRFLMIQLEEGDVESDVVMVLNWFEELRELAGN